MLTHTLPLLCVCYVQGEWSLTGDVQSGVAAVLLIDGNFVLVDANNAVLWQTGKRSSGMRACVLVLCDA